MVRKFSVLQTGKFLLGVSMAFVKSTIKNQFSKTANSAPIRRNFAVSLTEVRVSGLKKNYKRGKVRG